MLCKMLRIVLNLALLISVYGASITPDSQAETNEYKNTNDGNGNYFFRFVTSNGIAREETGRLVNTGQLDEYVAVHGFYSYIDTDGGIQRLYYTADTKGYIIQKQPPSVTYSVPVSVVASLLGK